MTIQELMKEAFELGRVCGNSYGVKYGIGGYQKKLDALLDRASKIPDEQTEEESNKLEV